LEIRSSVQARMPWRWNRILRAKRLNGASRLWPAHQSHCCKHGFAQPGWRQSQKRWNTSFR
jgi:hypothetical protein